MGGRARVDRRRVDEFNRFWEDLYKAFPRARAEAVEAMGQAVKKDLDTQIGAADLSAGGKGSVRSWQELRLGSKGGYAAVGPGKGGTGGRKKTWKGTPVSKRQVTKWLERGHGVRKPAPGSGRRWSRLGRSGINSATGTRFVKGRQFYSFTKLRAVDHALAAADKVLSHIADEVDY